MDEKRLDEIRKLPERTLSLVVSSTRYITEIRAALRDLLASHDTLTARIAELEGEVERLGNEFEWIDEHLFTDHVDADATLGFITGDTPEAKRLKAICHLLKDRTRLSTLEQAAGDAVRAAKLDEPADCATLSLKKIYESIIALASLLPEKGAKG